MFIILSSLWPSSQASVSNAVTALSLMTTAMWKLQRDPPACEFQSQFHIVAILFFHSFLLLARLSSTMSGFRGSRFIGGNITAAMAGVFLSTFFSISHLAKSNTRATKNKLKFDCFTHQFGGRYLSHCVLMKIETYS